MVAGLLSSPLRRSRDTSAALPDTLPRTLTSCSVSRETIQAQRCAGLSLGCVGAVLGWSTGPNRSVPAADFGGRNWWCALSQVSGCERTAGVDVQVLRPGPVGICRVTWAWPEPPRHKWRSEGADDRVCTRVVARAATRAARFGTVVPGVRAQRARRTARYRVARPTSPGTDSFTCGAMPGCPNTAPTLL